jgi:hypothetical protein
VRCVFPLTARGDTPSSGANPLHKRSDLPPCGSQVDRSFKDTVETVPPVSERLVALTCPAPARQAEARKSSLFKAAAAHGNGLAKLYTGRLK